MKKIFIASLIVVLFGVANSLFAGKKSATIEEKENAVKEKLKARKRMSEDTKKYSRKQLREIERLYQSRGYMNGGIEKTRNLEKVISKYPHANRAGCAMLSLGIYSRTVEKQENYLKKAFNKYDDCFYGNGIQVGAFARYWLATIYLKEGKKEQAYDLFKQIKEKYPNAIDNRKRLLTSQIDKKHSIKKLSKL